ncbi:hypothetical protein [Deinococcus hopiensis]|uniref:Uncharacterized protein n=1 Tax=Deinococcus hopiensis KR-140 TaxID=695939 RepID=A0A1W1U9J0_9DEIO|nr:hypothetical protein [Deinococcus hopiensis]SMB77700.1 hypothetical protein SAMN00790413_03867 [Deinococcus hopiensis KR-140]
MLTRDGKTVLPQRGLLEKYYMETRNHLLELAAFLDRLDRAALQDAQDDERLLALRRGLKVLTREEGGRVKDIQMTLSDQDFRILEIRDRQNAVGAPLVGEG